MTTQALRIVPKPVSTADVLREAFRARDEAQDSLRKIDAIIAAETRAFALEHGMKFMRVERVRQEVGA